MSTTQTAPPTTAPPPMRIDAGTSAWVRDVAEMLSRSGPYEGASPAQLAARIWHGIALGLDPATSCGAVTYSRGKPTFAAGLQAALLERSQRYDYEIKELTDGRCTVGIVRDGKPRGQATFTIEEAKRAGLLDKKGSAWLSYSSDLLFARALTRAIRRFAPDLLAGAVSYVAEELGGNAVREPIPQPSSKPSKPREPVANGKPQPPAEAKPARGTVTAKQLADLKACKETLQIPLETWRGQILAKRRVQSATELTTEQAGELLSSLRTRVNIRQLQDGFGEGNPKAAAPANGKLVIPIPASQRKEGTAAAAASKSDN